MPASNQRRWDQIKQDKAVSLVWNNAEFDLSDAKFTLYHDPARFRHMKLLELYEDLFQYVCRLNRAAKPRRSPITPGCARGEDADGGHQPRRLRGRAAGNQVKRLEMPIIFFVDNVICTSRLKFAAQWAQNRLAKERNELAGDERFFDFLEQDLADASEDAVERLAIYYTCLGLGFTGMYQGQPEQDPPYWSRFSRASANGWTGIRAPKSARRPIATRTRAFDGTAQQKNYSGGRSCFCF